jgi:hypothetical protein
MKKVLAALLILAFCAGAFWETMTAKYIDLRGSTASDDSVLDGTTANLTYQWADRPLTKIKGLGSSYNNVQIYFAGTDAANETCNYKIYAYREGGPATLVCSGVFTLGAAITGGTNEYFADAITATLPTAAIGLEYIINDMEDGAGVDVTIVPATPASESFTLASGLTDADDQLVADDDVHQMIHLKCFETGIWQVMSSTGTWD